MASDKARIRIELVNVHCYDTEDNLGGDEFYIVGGVIGGEQRQVVLTKPIDINDNQTKPFNPSEAVMFEGEISLSETVHLGIAAFDEDFSADWARYGQALKEMTNAINNLKPTPGQVGQQIIDTTSTAAQEVLKKIDPDDELGQLTFSLPVSDLRNGDKPWDFEGGTWMGKWKYKVTYRVTKVAVS
ncbi:hypothetical protein ACFWZ2_10305 [Streptomyces sp. NPDC059002]|uniref:hypothetical protein n=1 Tax=Streptomyces sp. NPDC059002 TaxID=3346690 RepID=UPI00367D582D